MVFSDFLFGFCGIANKPIVLAEPPTFISPVKSPLSTSWIFILTELNELLLGLLVLTFVGESEVLQRIYLRTFPDKFNFCSLNFPDKEEVV